MPTSPSMSLYPSGNTISANFGVVTPSTVSSATRLGRTSQELGEFGRPASLPDAEAAAARSLRGRCCWRRDRRRLHLRTPRRPCLPFRLDCVHSHMYAIDHDDRDARSNAPLPRMGTRRRRHPPDGSGMEARRRRAPDAGNHPCPTRYMARLGSGGTYPPRCPQGAAEIGLARVHRPVYS